MNDDQLFLANAYLDGELTPDDRVIAEADPTVMAAVQELGALQDALRDVAPAPAAARESAIAIAMAEFTAAPSTTGAAADAPPAPIPLARRTWVAPALKVAAGTLGVGLLAVVVMQLGGDDDDLADSEPVLEEFVVREESADASDQAGAVVSSEEPMIAAADTATDDGLDGAAESADAVDEDAGDDAADEDEPAVGDETVAEDDRAGTAIVGPGTRAAEPIRTATELRQFADQVIERRDLGRLGATPETRCEEPDILARAFVDIGATVVDTLIAVDPDTAAAHALDPDSCDVLLSAAPG